jgi:hypothetical protein
MEALQILKFSIKGGQVLSFTAGTSKAEEIAELEADTSESGSCPTKHIRLYSVLKYTSYYFCSGRG